MTPAAVAPATVAIALSDAGRRLAAAGLVTARQDAEVLLARALGTTRLGLYTTGRARVPRAAGAAFETLVARRAAHEPLQYLLGEAELSGVVLELGPGVFIPRPETEALVDRAVTLGPPGVATVLDLCTGSGAIACALATRRPGWTIWGVERARTAADCARANVRRLGLEARVRVREGDLFGPLRDAVAAGAVDLVVANPPYLAAPILPTLPVEVREWEPWEALDGGADGLDVIRRLLAQAPEWLHPGGELLVEIGEEQGPAVRAIVAAEARYAAALVHRDFRGCERVLEARRR
ncbi:MAG TPA: peptide chain release factor N(5)-glutamine methyltransferase [Methylomirabilota bacterium]|jgi:release factor glutamine methyltransferase